ncbi:MAG: hypothetical protein IIB09_04070, partial [Bacteroidetes bacterium]|nr:hypothetical protein [Bacteroidota bacterium]
MLPVAAVTVLVALAVGTFVVRDVQMLRAGFVSGDALAADRAGKRVEAITLFQQAVDIAPDVQQYRIHVVELLIEEARTQANDEAVLPILAQAYETFIGYEERDPLSFNTQLGIGVTVAELVKLGDDARRNELIDRTVRIAASMPAYPTIQAIASERILIAGEIELSLQLANRA